MAYQTTTATSQSDVLDKFRQFLTLNGWTQLHWGAEGQGHRLHVQKGLLFANFRSFSAELLPNHSAASGSGIAMNMSTGYTGTGIGFDVQPGYTPTSQLTGGRVACAGSMRFTGAIISCHFFTQNDFAACVVEVTAGVFQWMMFGQLDKIGTYTGGYFFTCSCQGFNYTAPTAFPGTLSNQPTPDPLHNFYPYIYASGASYVYVESGDSNWYGGGTTNGRAGPANGVHRVLGVHDGNPNLDNSRPNGLFKQFMAAQPNAYNSAAVLFPILAFVTTTSFSTTIPTLVGRMPDCRALMIDNIAPATDLALGADNWMVFPLWQKGGITGNRGFAIKKVV